MHRVVQLLASGAILIATISPGEVKAASNTWAGNRIKVERTRDGQGEILKIVSPKGRVLAEVEAPDGGATWEFVELDGKAPRELMVEVSLGARGAPAHYFFSAAGKFHRLGFLFGAYIDLKLKDLDRNGTQELIAANSVSYMEGIGGADGVPFKFVSVYGYRSGRLHNISKKYPAIVHPYLAQAKKDLRSSRDGASDYMEGVPAAAAWYCCALELGEEQKAAAEITRQLTAKQRRWFQRFRGDFKPGTSTAIPLSDQ